MATVYILYSTTLDKYYVGFTTTTVSERLSKHNTSYYGNKSFTSKADDWKLMLELVCDDRPHGSRLEKKIKSMKSKVYVQNLLKYPEMQEKIISETRLIK